jgi:serine/threonine protein kinase
MRNKLSLKFILSAAEQIITRLQFIHKLGFVHRDIKPENFLVGGAKKSNILHMIDFGLTKRFLNPKTGKHIKYKDGLDITGTIRFISINTHDGIEHSRRDDLESTGYLLMYLLMGKLPWQGIKAKYKKEKYELIKQSKIDMTKEELWKGFPEEFQLYFDYVLNLEFEEDPNYDYLKRLFKDLFLRMGYEHDRD